MHSPQESSRGSLSPPPAEITLPFDLCLGPKLFVRLHHGWERVCYLSKRCWCGFRAVLERRTRLITFFVVNENRTVVEMLGSTNLNRASRFVNKQIHRWKQSHQFLTSKEANGNSSEDVT